MTTTTWPAGDKMHVACPKCGATTNVQIAVVREDNLPWRPVDCFDCNAEFILNSNGSTELPARTKNQSRQMEPITIFDPDGWKNFPFTTQVEVLLGGVGRAVYPDDTEQFLDQGMNGEVELTYSPRLAPDELEEFCRKNIAHYEAFNAAHAHELDECKRVPMVQFWPDDQAT
jgi:hypothetical protein